MRSRVLILLAIQAISCGGQAPGPEPSRPAAGGTLMVGAAFGEEADAAILSEAVATAGPGTEILLSEGVHWIDNPVTLQVPGLTISGQGRAATTLRPKHSGLPVFSVTADWMALRDLTVHAVAQDGRGRATFAVLAEGGCRGCTITGMAIIGTGASAIHAVGLRDFVLGDSIILDAGNDAVFLRGKQLRISRNVFVRYYDEAIDNDPEGIEGS